MEHFHGTFFHATQVGGAGPVVAHVAAPLEPRRARRQGGDYGGRMSDSQSDQDRAEVADARQEAAEHVVERVESWDEGAEPGTVRRDLEEGMAQAGVSVDDAELDRMAEDIHDEGRTQTPDVG